MKEIPPIYTTQNCRFAYQLNWSLTIFWKGAMVAPDIWLDSVKKATEKDEVRILEHHPRADRLSQFLLSTKPNLAPPKITRSLKGRLQYEIRDLNPKALRRTYAIQSVGAINTGAVDQYIASQTDRHPVSDPRVQSRLAQVRIDQPEVDLSSRRRSSYAEYLYNLHLVFVRTGRHRISSLRRIEGIRRILLAVARKKGHLIRSAGILPDHIHLAMGASLLEAPAGIACAYLNNLSYFEGMQPVYEFGGYLGTFGSYDRDAIRRVIRTAEHLGHPADRQVAATKM